MDILSTGALIYMLNLFCNSQNPSVREQTAALIAKMITDKLVGPRVRIVLAKFLPHIFMDAMRDSPEAAVVMFESKNRNWFLSFLLFILLTQLLYVYVQCTHVLVLVYFVSHSYRHSRKSGTHLE